MAAWRFRLPLAYAGRDADFVNPFTRWLGCRVVNRFGFRAVCLGGSPDFVSGIKRRRLSWSTREAPVSQFVQSSTSARSYLERYRPLRLAFRRVLKAHFGALNPCFSAIARVAMHNHSSATSPRTKRPANNCGESTMAVATIVSHARSTR
jgi:hypothetical protein